MSDNTRKLLLRALHSLEGASRMLTEDCKSALNGKAWCSQLIQDIKTELLSPSGWRPIETAPSSMEVLVLIPDVTIPSVKKVTKAIHIPYMEVRAEDMGMDDWDDDYLDYDEETNIHYAPEGWYEVIDAEGCDFSHFCLSSKQIPLWWRDVPYSPEIAKESI